MVKNIIFVLAAALAGTSATARTADNLSTASLRASTAVLFQNDARGEPVPLCVTDVSNKPELVTLSVVSTHNPEPQTQVSLPICTQTELKLIQEVARNASREKYAVVPGVVGSLCAVDFLVSAGVVMAANVSRNRMLTDNATGFALGAGVGSGVARGIDLAAKLGLGGVGFACSAAGIYVGYLLVPGYR